MSSQTEAFYATRSELLASKLISRQELLTLRSRIDDALASSEFCDGCGFCCRASVPLTRLELARVRALVERDPGLFVEQGPICPFLEFDRARFDRNLETYGKKIAPLEPSPCRIYHERPIICRLFPAPNNNTCRKNATLVAPDLNELLKDEDFEDYPHLLIQKYYVTLDWDNRNVPERVLDPELLFMLAPGWRVNREQQTLVCCDDVAWIDGLFNIMPDAYPKPDECELDHWAVEVMASFARPTSYAEVLERHTEKASVEEIAALLGQAEIANILMTVDAPRRANPGLRSVWDLL
jgi:Fe-S-cluster containining protein